MEPKGSIPCSQQPANVTFLSYMQFRGHHAGSLRCVFRPRPASKLEDHTLSAVRDRLFNIFRG